MVNENDIIKIKCPNDGSILAVKNHPGLENKNITCPVCKRLISFKDFIKIDQDDVKTKYKDNDEETQYGSKGNNKEYTKVKDLENLVIGELKIDGEGAAPYKLKVGKNIIGRKPEAQNSASKADIQIPTGGKKRMSREHFVIEVKRVEGKGFVHYASLFKAEVNATSVNGTKIEFGDCVILKHGDKVELPDKTLLFELPDSDNTTY